MVELFEASQLLNFVFHRVDPFLIHDVALVRVNGTILFSDKVTPINLPSCDFEVKKDGESKLLLFLRRIVLYFVHN